MPPRLFYATLEDCCHCFSPINSAAVCRLKVNVRLTSRREPGHSAQRADFCSSIQNCKSAGSYRTERPIRTQGMSPQFVMAHSLRGEIANA